MLEIKMLNQNQRLLSLMRVFSLLFFITFLCFFHTKKAVADDVYNGYLIVWHSEKSDINFNKYIKELSNHTKSYGGIVIPMESVNNIILISKNKVSSSNLSNILPINFTMQMKDALPITLDTNIKYRATPFVFRTPIIKLMNDVENLTKIIVNLGEDKKIDINKVKDIINTKASFQKVDLINMLATPPYNKRFDF